jgi:transcriptional regulator with XRE-family HTH domain
MSEGEMAGNTSNRIAELRKRRGLTQEELGFQMKADLTGSTVAKLEKGRQKLTVDYACDIADVLGASLYEVIGKDEDRQMITNDRLLSEVQAIQSTLSKSRDDLDRMSKELRSVKAHIAGLIESGLRQEQDLTSLRQRIERIERRLELND